MQRRSFTKGAIAAGIGGMTANPAKANIINPDEGRDGRLPEFGRVTVMDLSVQIEVRFLVVVDNFNERIGIDLRSVVRQVDENRANTSNIPILGELTRNMRSRVEEADVVGDTYLLNDIIVARVQSAVLNSLGSVSISHLDVTYILSTFKRVRFGDFPLFGNIPGIAKLFGETRLDDEGLMVLLRPTLVMGDRI